MADTETRQYEARAHYADEQRAAYDEAQERFALFFGGETEISGPGDDDEED